MEERKQKEVEFHNERELLRQLDMVAYEHITKNKKFYSITQSSQNYLENWFREKCPRRNFLDYCCGTGSFSMMATKYGAKVVGIDISAESIISCKKLSAENWLKEKPTFCIMDAESLGFKENSFDIIFCGGVLHHLDIKKAFQELWRLIKPNGEIFCGEALGYNPLINWYRRRTLHMRTEWEVDHILTLKEIDLARQYFENVEIKFFHLAAIAAVPFRNLTIFKYLLSFLQFLDDFILKLPVIQKQAWQVFFILSKPKKNLVLSEEMSVAKEGQK